MRARLTLAQTRTWISMIAATVLVGFGVWQQQVSWIAMGVGVLGAPSISVIVGKEIVDDEKD